ncbi:hypothetical protein LY90DRAFT_703487 [Neocallimastix californiae]|uniref:Phospholipid/glycerol acyltransferase domain-containing protein n=1 Tax=Neocallimastix californiae TaxID=1754190 RepID=A0A1Y2CFU9_9FUNG|nr:hypothetical protein LY90DRAFT_703487 [Neocallimastix californiae]|eukprot:ORY45777.1 hypothetical protein LY90DRAFT_703487 [Neocallimastix californiae]
MHTSSENYNNSNEYTDFLINDETKEAEIFKMDTVTFIKKYDANSRNLRKRKIYPIAKRLHMESICVVSKLHELPWYKYLEYSILSCTLMPLRVIVAGFSIVICYFFMMTVVLFEGLEKKHINNPNSEHYGKPVHRIPKVKWRRYIINFLSKSTSKFIMFFGLGFYNVKVKDLRKKDKIDWIRTTPLISGLANALQCIYVNPNKKTGLTHEISARAKESEKYDLPPFAIFPEGTTTNGTHLIDFRYGAFRPFVPVQPIAIKYKYKYYNPSYVVDKGFKYALKTAMQFKNDLEIVFLPVVELETEEEKTDIEVWTEKNYQILAKELDIPLDRLCSRPQKMFYLDYVRGKCDFETAEKEIYKIYNQRLEEYKKKSNKTIKS